MSQRSKPIAAALMLITLAVSFGPASAEFDPKKCYEKCMDKTKDRQMCKDICEDNKK
jgi:hypothetical protein